MVPPFQCAISARLQGHYVFLLSDCRAVWADFGPICADIKEVKAKCRKIRSHYLHLLRTLLLRSIFLFSKNTESDRFIRHSVSRVISFPFCPHKWDWNLFGPPNNPKSETRNRALRWPLFIRVLKCLKCTLRMHSFSLNKTAMFLCSKNG